MDSRKVHVYLLSSASVGLGLVLDRSGWTMLTVLALNHASSPAQTVVLDPTIVSILRMWQFTAAQVRSSVATIMSN